MKQDKKLSYDAPKIDIVTFDAKDIITTSGFSGGELPLAPTSVTTPTNDPAGPEALDIMDVSEEIF